MDKAAVIAILSRLPSPLSNQAIDYPKLKLTWEDAPILLELIFDEGYQPLSAEQTQSWLPIHAWRALSELGIPVGLDRLLNQLDHLMSYPLAEYDLPIVLAGAGQRGLPALATSLQNSALSWAARNVVADAMQRIAKDCPDELATITKQVAAFVTEQEAQTPAEADLGFSEMPLPAQHPVAENISIDELYVRLQEHLDYYASEYAIQDVSGLDGFFTALSCAPKQIDPGIWLPALWGSEEYMPEFPSTQALTLFMELVMKLYIQNYQHLQSTEHFVAAFRLEQDTELGLVTEQGKILVETWCDGFMRGAVLGNPALIELSGMQALFAPIALFGTEEGYAKLQTLAANEVGAWQQQIEPQVLKIRDAARQAIKVDTHVRDTPKVGRNDLCPCGSGKKYKKCCLQ